MAFLIASQPPLWRVVVFLPGILQPHIPKLPEGSGFTPQESPHYLDMGGASPVDISPMVRSSCAWHGGRCRFLSVRAWVRPAAMYDERLSRAQRRLHWG